MKKIFLFISLISSLTLAAQKEINGVVYSTGGWPLSGVVLSQPDANKFYYTDGEGKFTMSLDTLFRDEIIFYTLDYQKIIIPNLSQQEEDLVVLMFPKYSFELIADTTILMATPKAFPLVNVDFFIDAVRPDFDNFRPFLGERVTDYMNNKVGFLGMEIGLRRKRYYLGFNYGFLFAEAAKKDEDLDRLETINYSLGLKFGYRILDKRRFFLQPAFNVRMLRYRIIRRQNESVDLPEFLANPDLDLRFRQGAATFGIEFGFKIPIKKRGPMSPDSYQAFGAYINYFQKLNRFPDLNGVRTVIDTNERINFSKLNFGIFYRMGQN